MLSHLPHIHLHAQLRGRARSSTVERPLCKREAGGSIPPESILLRALDTLIANSIWRLETEMAIPHCGQIPFMTSRKGKQSWTKLPNKKSLEA